MSCLAWIALGLVAGFIGSRIFAGRGSAIEPAVIRTLSNTLAPRRS